MNALLEILNGLHPEVDFATEPGLIDNKILIDDSILDSVDIVTIVAEIDAEYDVAVPVEELTPENFNSAQAIYAMICRLEDE